MINVYIDYHKPWVVQKFGIVCNYDSYEYVRIN